MLGCGTDPRVVSAGGRRSSPPRSSPPSPSSPPLVLAPNTADPDEAVIDLPGFAAVRARHRRAGLRHHRRRRGRMDHDQRRRRPRASPPPRSSRSSAGSCARERPMLDVRLFAPARLQHRHAGADRAVPVPVRVLPRRAAVPAADPRLQPAAERAVPAADGAIVMPMSRVAPHLVDRVRPAGRDDGRPALPRRRPGDHGPARRRLDRTGTSSLGLVVFGFGMAFTSTPSTTAIVTSLPRAKQGVGSAVNDVSRELGSALGIAILGSLFNSGYRGAVERRHRRRCRPRPPTPSRSRPAPVSPSPASSALAATPSTARSATPSPPGSARR